MDWIENVGKHNRPKHLFFCLLQISDWFKKRVQNVTVINNTAQTCTHILYVTYTQSCMLNLARQPHLSTNTFLFARFMFRRVNAQQFFSRLKLRTHSSQWARHMFTCNGEMTLMDTWCWCGDVHVACSASLLQGNETTQSDILSLICHSTWWLWTLEAQWPPQQRTPRTWSVRQ